MQQPILILGAGPMAIAYTKVLQAMQLPVITIGRGAQSAAAYQEETSLPVVLGGFHAWRQANSTLPVSHAIVAVGEAWLGETTRELIASGIKNVLVEKPGGFTAEDIRSVAAAAKQYKANVYVAYNRRFYAAVTKAQEIIEQDGGVLSFNFEFTEWGHVIADLAKEPGVKEHWFLANSTHVIDLAFYLGGKPEQLSCYTARKLAWHPNAAIYAGAGRSQNGALFSYQANWQAPGRWGVEVLTAKHRLIFRPMEKLQIQKIGSVAIEEVAINDELDKQYKPGLYKQVDAFMNQPNKLLTIEEQVSILPYYEMINTPAKV